MQEYYGTKRIQARPMNRLEYNYYRGWQVPADENPLDEGYLVEYMDGGTANHPAHLGYISWSPKQQFEGAYQPITALSFGHALEALEIGFHVGRSGWNGKGMFLFLEKNAPGLAPFIVINTGTECRPWLASQADMLANDWEVVERDLGKPTAGDVNSIPVPSATTQADITDANVQAAEFNSLGEPSVTSELSDISDNPPSQDTPATGPDTSTLDNAPSTLPETMAGD